MALENVFESYLQHGKFLKNWSDKTSVIYRRAFASLQAALRETEESNLPSDDVSSPANLTKARLQAWVIRMRQNEMSPAGCNIYIRAVNAFTAWLKDEGYVSERYIIKQVPDPKNPIPVFSEVDLRRIVTLRPTRFNQRRLWTLICLLLDTGCRIDEVLNLRGPDCDFDNLLLAVKGKGNKHRKVPFSSELRKSLFRYQAERTKRGVKGDYLFGTRNGTRLKYRNTHRDILVLCRNLGINGPRISPHTFRHSFAINYIKNGGDIYSLSRILGHSSISTTQLYLRSMGVEALGQLHSQFSPLARL